MAFFTKNDGGDTVLELENGKQIDYDSVNDACMPGYTWQSAKSVVYKEDMDNVYSSSKRPPADVIADARRRLEAANA